MNEFNGLNKLNKLNGLNGFNGLDVSVVADALSISFMFFVLGVVASVVFAVDVAVAGCLSG